MLLVFRTGLGKETAVAVEDGVGRSSGRVEVEGDADTGAAWPPGAWRIFTVVILTLFTAMLAMGMGVLVLPIYAHELGAAGLSLGFLFAGFSVSRSVFAPLVGRASDERGRKVFLIWGLGIYVCVSAGYLLATSYLHLIVLRFVSGFGAAMILPVAQARIGEIVPRGAEGKVMSMLNLSIFAGWGTGPIVGGYLRDAFGINVVFLSMGLLLAIALVIVSMFLPSEERAGQAATCPKTSAPPLHIAMGDSMVRAVLAARVGVAWGRGAMIGFLPVYGATVLQLTQFQVGLAISLLVLISGSMQVPAGVLADRTDRVRLVVGGMVPSSVALLLLPWVSSFGQLLVLAIILGLTAGLYQPTLVALQVTLGRRMGMGVIMGLASTGMSAGMICGSLTSGIIMDAWGIRNIFVVNGLVGFVAVAFFLWFVSRTPPQVP